jgi:hypothetical protein
MAGSTQELNLVEYPRSSVPTAKLVHPGMEQGDDDQPPPAAFRLELEHPLQLVHIDFRHGFRQSPRRAVEVSRSRSESPLRISSPPLAD